MNYVINTFTMTITHMEETIAEVSNKGQAHNCPTSHGISTINLLFRIAKI